jgi:hypothetical protein
VYSIKKEGGGFNTPSQQQLLAEALEERDEPTATVADSHQSNASSDHASSSRKNGSLHVINAIGNSRETNNSEVVHIESYFNFGVFNDERNPKPFVFWRSARKLVSIRGERLEKTQQVSDAVREREKSST